MALKRRCYCLRREEKGQEATGCKVRPANTSKRGVFIRKYGGETRLEKELQKKKKEEEEEEKIAKNDNSA